ncbi:DUF222 domain-containing protein, partial [Mycobacterium ostraviense]
MFSTSREEVVATFDSLKATMARLLELSFDALTTPERLVLLEHCETTRRQLPSIEQSLINQIAEQSTEEELGGRLPAALASRLRITRAEAGRRVGEAAELGQRLALTGEPLAPQLSATAAAQRDGQHGPPPVSRRLFLFGTDPLEWEGSSLGGGAAGCPSRQLHIRRVRARRGQLGCGGGCT